MGEITKKQFENICSGLGANPNMLKRMRTAGIISINRQSGLGGRGGSIVTYDPTMIERVQRTLSLLETIKNYKLISCILFIEGHDIQWTYIQDALISIIQMHQKQLSKLTAKQNSNKKLRSKGAFKSQLVLIAEGAPDAFNNMTGESEEVRLLELAIGKLDILVQNMPELRGLLVEELISEMRYVGTAGFLSLDSIYESLIHESFGERAQIAQKLFKSRKNPIISNHIAFVFIFLGVIVLLKVEGPEKILKSLFEAQE